MGRTHRFGRSPLLDVVADRIEDAPRLSRLPKVGVDTAWEFAATPEALRDAWLTGRGLEAGTEPGDLVITDDARGTAGVFALDQIARPAEERRTVAVVAGDSRTLEYLWVAGTVAGAEPDHESEIDWEIALYRFATHVVTPSRVAADLLGAVGIRDDVVVVDVAESPPGHRRDPAAVRTAWLPEPLSRRARTPTMLRALADAGPDTTVIVSSASEPDRIWAGTTREANAPLFDLLGDRAVVRRRAPRRPDLVVLGDPFSLPSREVAGMRDRGVAIAVPAGSTAACLWPEALQWSSEEDLVAIVAGEPPTHRGATPMGVAEALTLPSGPGDDGRARRVSVAVPVFRDVRFLDECLQSIVSQTQTPHEVILVDDGSRSSDVDDALDRWVERHPRLVRVLRQPNRGVCVARNTALDVMTGDAFLLVDADDVIQPSFVEKTATALGERPDLWAVATWTEFFGDYNGVEAKPPFDERVARRENPIVSTCVLVDMKVRDLGIRFAPDLAFIYCEDWDFWAQIAAAGGRFGLVPEPLARHRVHRGSGARLRSPLAHRIGKARATAWLSGRPIGSREPDITA
jgi:GT2 family glycosyltransferase